VYLDVGFGVVGPQDPPDVLHDLRFTPLDGQTDVVARVEFHPEFAAQYEQLCTDVDLLELAGEITQLIDALEQYGHEIEGDASEDPSHPIVISRLAMFALRRTPPTVYTPYATDPTRHPHSVCLVRRRRD